MKKNTFIFPLFFKCLIFYCWKPPIHLSRKCLNYLPAHVQIVKINALLQEAITLLWMSRNPPFILQAAISKVVRAIWNCVWIQTSLKAQLSSIALGSKDFKIGSYLFVWFLVFRNHQVSRKRKCPNIQNTLNSLN